MKLFGFKVGKSEFDKALEGATPIQNDDELRRDHLERVLKMREHYAKVWGRVAIAQICITMFMVGLQGCGSVDWSLEPSVMIAFLGSTSLNALSVVLAISKGLFNPRS